MPVEATEPCHLAVGDYLDLADLELVARERGREIVDCDGKRALAVATHQRQQQAIARQLAQRAARARPVRAWISRLLGRGGA
jgi:hypothetical protein